MLQVYKAVLFYQCGTAILAFLAVLFINVFAIVFVVNRRFFLKDTKTKLTHLDRQLQVGQGELPAPKIDSVDEELG
jgi:uncharacterized membrane protein YciS (DUF1049 family)